ncbi:response regulator [Spirulina sp. CS-785/01]|uniref:response regulator n=1 Tax=Spirulina sp. CS-785/01 TaxID=3021716 RepID=UPI002330690C|nr:response regulator [Spirulina sp. CS-785/01]MDB9315737.1 response regulator [Spirulina sp. CS-785/01]
MRLLLVEDDKILAQTIGNALTEQGYIIDIAYDGEAGQDYAAIFSYDLILLDVSLPKQNGIDLCRQLRHDNFNNPILLLTAKDRSEDKVAGLDAGADDYVVKPCTIPELLARIRALLRRQGESGSPVLEWGDLQFNPSTCEVYWQDQPLSLSPKEYNLLELFLRNPKRVFSKNAILEHLWSFDDPPSEDTIRAHIKGLRRKLKAVGAKQLIETVYGLGYRLKAIPASPNAPPKQSSPESEQLSEAAEVQQEQDKQAKQEKTLAAVAQMWDQFQAPILQRLGPIEEAIAALEEQSLSPELREKAEKQAHKLAGSLGMYGLEQGSKWAREVEHWLIDKQNSTQAEVHELKTWVMQLREVIEHPPFQENKEDGVEAPSLPPLIPVQSSLRLLCVDEDMSLLSSLQEEGERWNVQVEQVGQIEEAIKRIAWPGYESPQNPSPDLILLNVAFPHPANEGLIFLRDLAEYCPQLPVLVTGEGFTFNNRIAIARLGGDALLAKPLDSTQVLQTACSLWQRYHPPAMMLLAVDDDPLILTRLEDFVTPWGIELHTLADPRLFWETLEQYRPNLIILDVEMPYINGIELCQVVRSDPTWHHVPILFLSTNRDRETIHRIYQVGADDYISKPVTEPELMTRILNRIIRSRP